MKYDDERMDKGAFVRKHEKKKQDNITVWFNKEERELLDKSKHVLEQEKDSTALKQLAWIGAKILGDDQMSYIVGTIFENKRKNKRLGIIEFE